MQAADLTCTQHWLQNLRLLRESIWPGGTLPKGPRLVRTPEQKAATEKQALSSLMGIVPGVDLSSPPYYPIPFRGVGGTP